MLYKIKDCIMADIRQNKHFTLIKRRAQIIRYSYYLLSMPRAIGHYVLYACLSPILDCLIGHYKFQNQMAMVLIIKNESSYIEEWIEFHKIIGFTKFYIFDNNSTDDLKNKLEPYIKAGVVEYIYFPGIGMQGKAYTYACRKYRWKTKYMMMLDVDEFVYPVGENYKLLTIIEQLFQLNNCGGIGVNLRWYGNSGYEKKPEGCVTESYIYRANDEWDYNRASNIIKTISNPRRVFLFEGPTHPLYCAKYTCINEKGKLVDGAWAMKPSFQMMRINHYWARSKEEFLDKQKRGNVNTGVTGDKTWELYEHYNRNEKFDDSILRWWNGNKWWEKKHQKECI